jgi:predicted PurR-regulated permease PerM
LWDRTSVVIFRNPAYDRTQINLALEAAIHIGLTILLATACLLILRPFLLLLLWGIIIAVAIYPAFQKLQRLFGEREVLAAVVITVLLLAFLIVPVFFLTQAVFESVQTLTSHLKNGTLNIPPPPVQVDSWPIIGAPLNSLWSEASRDLNEMARSYAPEIKAAVPKLLSASAGIGLTMLQFLFSIVVAGVLLANARAGYEVSHSFCNRFFGDKGPEFQQLIGATIRSVTSGIVGVSLLQALLADIGFHVAGLPGAGLWAVVFLIASVLQAGFVILTPAVAYMFAISTVAKALIFLAWCVMVGLVDSVLKPIMMGRGVAVPLVVVFLGALGGFAAWGFIGMFLGAIVLSVGYKLFRTWLDQTPTVQET